MESSIVQVMHHANHGQGNNSAAASSQSGRSSAKNSSISIDLEILLPKREAGDCKHFKIRQYAVEMREKDRNICLPFASDGNSIEQLLPPMVVPKSKWWLCQNCLYGNGAVRPLEEAVVFSKCCERGLISRTTCSPTLPNYELEIVQSDRQDAPQQNNSEGRIIVDDAPANSSIGPEIDLSIPIDKNEKCTEVAQIKIGQENVDKGESQEATPVILRGDEKHPSPYNYKKEKNTEMGHRAVNEIENSSYDDSIHESANANYNLPRDDRVAVKSKSIVFVDTSITTPGNQDTSDSFPAIEYPKHKAKSTEACPRKEFDSLDEEPSNGLAGSIGSNEISKLNKFTSAVNGQLVKHPSLQIEAGGNSLPESDKHRDMEDDSSEDSERPMKKKRYVHDLMRLKGNSENSRCGTEGSPSNFISGVQSTSVSFTVPQGRGYQHENVLGVKVPQRKRKTPHGQERKSMETNCPSNLSKRAGASKGNADISTKAIQISDSDSDSDSNSDSDSDSDSEGKVDGVAANNCYNNIWSGRERSSLGKNRKPTQFGGQKIPKLPCREAIGNINHTEIRGVTKQNSAVDISSSKSKYDSSTGRGMDFRGYMPPRQQKEKKSSLPKKRNSMLQVQDSRDLARPHIDHMLGQGPMKRKDVETMRNGTEFDAHADIPLDLTLNSYMPSHKDGKGHAKAGRGVVSSIPTGKSNIFHKDLTRKDDFFAGKSSASRDSTPGPSLEATLHSLKDKLAHNNAKLREQRNYSPLPQNSNFPLAQNLNFSDPHYNVKNRGIQKNPEAMKLKCDQRANKGFSEGNSDEIEEIAELMAKNQHERVLSQAERSCSQFINDDNRTNANVTPFPKGNGKGVMTWTQREFPGTIARKSPSSTATANMRNMGSNSNLAPTKSNLPDWSDTLRYSFKNGPMENPSSLIFDAFSQSQSQPKVLSGGDFSELGAVRNRNWQSSQQNDKFTANMSSPTNMQYVEPFNRSYSGFLPSEGGRSWSPLISNHLPFDSIHQKGQNESSNLRMYAPLMGEDKGKRIPNLDLNVVDLNGASLDEQNRSFSMESFKNAPAEYQFFTKNNGTELNPKGKGPLDASYSNEAIPAMQLLSLMDAGMQSNKPLNKPLSACSNHLSISRNEKPDLVEKEFFPKSGPRSGPNESSSSLNSAHGRNHHLPVKTWEFTPFSPVNNPYSSLFRNTENVRRAPAVPGQLFGRSLEQERAKAPYTPAYDQGRRFEKSSISPIDDLIRLGGLVPSKDKQKGIYGGVDSLVFPFQRQNISDPIRSINLGRPFMQGTVGPMQGQPKTDVCSINRNPADFSYPDATNEYMINGEELKVGKKVLSRGKSVLENGNGRKKQRVRKIAPANERAQAQNRPT